MNLVTMTALALVVSAAADLGDYKRQLYDGSAQFTRNMLTEVVKANPDKSVVLSAFSVLPALAQLSLAAVGASHDELLSVMGLQNDNATRAVFPAVLSALKSIRGVQLKWANKVYVALHSQLQEQFKTDARQIFDSEVQSVDFTKSQATADAINKWVEEKTNHRIEALVDPGSLDILTRAVMVNAIYFKGNWKEKFNTKNTKDQDFHVAKDKIIKLPTMHKIDILKYLFTPELEAELLEIPYEGDEISFFILLPRHFESLSDLQQKIKENPSILANVTRRMTNKCVSVRLPKFKIKTKIDLKEVLRKIGIAKIFEPQTARLDNLLKSGEPLYVSEAVQKAYIEINEEGAEAAAANENMERIVTGPLRFIADRPFLFALKVRDGPVLFSGVFRG